MGKERQRLNPRWQQIAPSATQVGLFLLLALSCNHPCVVLADDRGVFSQSGYLELRAEALRMQHVWLQTPEMKLVHYTRDEEPNSPDWQISLRQEPGDVGIWRLRLEQQTDVVRRRVDYLFALDQEDEAEASPTPLIAMETAVDIDSGLMLYRVQTIDWTVEDARREETRRVDLGRMSLWVLGHLQEVYNAEILNICTDHYGHNADPDGFQRGFASSVACIKRRIEIDPQDIEAYTLSAWLLWSDWVTWTLYPNRIPKGQEKLEEAIRLIKLGRAANPKNAAYHLDAAQTLEPLALHHRPELVALVIRYYRYAEDLATEPAIRIRARLSLGHRFRQLGQTEEAVRWYQKVLKIDPENRVALRILKKLKNEGKPKSSPDGSII